MKLPAQCCKASVTMSLWSHASTALFDNMKDVCLSTELQRLTAAERLHMVGRGTRGCSSVVLRFESLQLSSSARTATKTELQNTKRCQLVWHKALTTIRTSCNQRVPAACPDGTVNYVP